MDSSKLSAHLRDVFGPDAELLATKPLGVADHDTGLSSLLHLTVRADGAQRQLVLRRATPTVYGTEQFPDRAREILQARALYDRLPRHPRAVGVALQHTDGSLMRLPDDVELVLLHEFAEGEVYVGDLIRCLQSGSAEEADLRRAGALGEYLAELHAERSDDQRSYRRALRDFVAGGNGVMGVLGGYSNALRDAFHARLGAILRDVVGLAWEIEQRPGPLCRAHGDFHPLNILFGPDGRPLVIDATGSGWGDPAFDVGTMYANFQTLCNDPDRLGTAAGRQLAARFLDAYVARCDDPDALYRALPLAVARSVLIVATESFFPHRSMDERGRLIGLAGDVLSAGVFEPALFAS